MPKFVYLKNRDGKELALNVASVAFFRESTTDKDSVTIQLFGGTWLFFEIPYAELKRCLDLCN